MSRITSFSQIPSSSVGTNVSPTYFTPSNSPLTWSPSDDIPRTPLSNTSSPQNSQMIIFSMKYHLHPSEARLEKFRSMSIQEIYANLHSSIWGRYAFQYLKENSFELIETALEKCNIKMLELARNFWPHNRDDDIIQLAAFYGKSKCLKYVITFLNIEPVELYSPLASTSDNEKKIQNLFLGAVKGNQKNLLEDFYKKYRPLNENSLEETSFDYDAPAYLEINLTRKYPDPEERDQEINNIVIYTILENLPKIFAAFFTRITIDEIDLLKECIKSNNLSIFSYILEHSQKEKTPQDITTILDTWIEYENSYFAFLTEIEGYFYLKFSQLVDYAHEVSEKRYRELTSSIVLYNHLIKAIENRDLDEINYLYVLLGVDNIDDYIIGLAYENDLPEIAEMFTTDKYPSSLGPLKTIPKTTGII